MKKIKVYEGVIDGDIGIRVNGNESYKNISEDELEEVINITKGSKFNRYPDSDSNKLREAYGNIINLSSENIIAGNGSDEMISLILSAYIKKKNVVLTLNPDFSMYDFYTSLYGGIIKKYDTEEDGSFSVNKFINFARRINPTIIIFSNPNNPTGHVITNEDITMILDSFPQCIVVIDEAYYEFYGQTVISYIESYKNLIVTRTLSKAWGLAALRVGFLISNIDIIKELNSYKVPYNLNQLSQDIACSILNHPEKIVKDISTIVYERERLYKNLKEIENKEKVEFYKSKGNFIFGRSVIKEKIKKTMEDKGILIRYFNDGNFRISIGAPWENDLIVSAMKIALDCEEESSGL